MTTSATSTAIDALIVEQVQRLRSAGADRSLYLSITTYNWSAADGVTVSHNLHYDSGAREIKLEGNSISLLVDKMIQMLAIRGDIEEPRTYKPALPAPDNNAHIEEAIVEPLSPQPNSLPDDVPF